jgi:Phage tail lysozyme/Peptidase_C39 like family
VRRRRQNLMQITIALCILLLGTQQVSAISDTYKATLEKGIYYFNPDVGSGDSSCSGSVTNLTGNDNAQKAFNYFTSGDRNLSAFAAAGIVGNGMYESGGLNPTRSQATHKDTPADQIISLGLLDGNGSKGDAWGAFQWDPPSKVINGLKSQNKDPNDFGDQLDFLWQSLKGDPAYYLLPQLKAATTPEQAADIFEQGFERASAPALQPREHNARTVYNTYGAGAGTATPAAATGTTTLDNSSSQCAGSGNFSTNFTEYKQCDYGNNTVPWASAPYGPHTVCSDGCGPSAMAMIITNLTGQKVTPDMTAAYGAANGTYDSTDGGGSNWNIAQVIGSHWGLKATGELKQNITAINQILQAGGLVIATGKGAVPFTSGGHFIVIRALTSDGKWLTGNSAGIDSSKPYDPAEVILNGSQGHIFNAWGLTKS